MAKPWGRGSVEVVEGNSNGDDSRKCGKAEDKTGIETVRRCSLVSIVGMIILRTVP